VKKSKKARKIKGEKREYPGFLQQYEKPFLVRIAKKIPRFMNSDHFTLLAFFSSLAIFFCYFLGPKYPYLYLLSIAFWFLHYIGDSLDGTIARVRHEERPRYGYYVDHILDSISVFFMLAGIAFSGITNPFIWLILLIVVLIIFISGFLKVYVQRKFIVGLRFLRISGTEARIAMSIFSLILFAYVNLEFLQKIELNISGFSFNIVDLFGLIALLIGIFSLFVDILLTSVRLHKEDTELLMKREK